MLSWARSFQPGKDTEECKVSEKPELAGKPGQRVPLSVLDYWQSKEATENQDQSNQKHVVLHEVIDRYV